MKVGQWVGAAVSCAVMLIGIAGVGDSLAWGTPGPFHGMHFDGFFALSVGFTLVGAAGLYETVRPLRK